MGSVPSDETIRELEKEAYGALLRALYANPHASSDLLASLQLYVHNLSSLYNRGLGMMKTGWDCAGFGWLSHTSKKPAAHHQRAAHSAFRFNQSGFGIDQVRLPFTPAMF